MKNVWANQREVFMHPVLIWEGGQEPKERMKVDVYRELTLSSAVCASHLNSLSAHTRL